MRQGALARLYMSGAIDADLLAAGHEIAMAAELIMRDVDLRTASLETRIDVSRHGEAFHEALGRVWIEAAYSAWRRETGPLAALVLDIALHDVGLTAAASRHHVSTRTARTRLIEALERWRTAYQQARDDIDATALTRAQAAVL